MAQRKTSHDNKKSTPLNIVSADAVMRQDLFRLRREQDPQRFEQALTQSTEKRRQRVAALEALDLSVSQELPIAAHAEELTTLIGSHQVVIVAGETGSGKTTQLPKLCLALGLGAGGMVGHTQPRRLAARTVAKRVASEVGAKLGEQVGFAVRFTDQVGPQTLVKVMTDGLLLTEIRRDRYLEAYDILILDEAHERSLNIDFLLGYLRRVLSKRRDFKLIITSATIDVGRFSKFFGGAPTVSVSGRAFPVDTRYVDATEDVLEGVSHALQEIAAKPLTNARDTLVFFSGEREIFEAAKELRKTFAERFEILPLYARLSFPEQQKIFEPSGGRRRVILATNVAETSLTVPNIGYVIDPGFARINRYSYRSKLQRLPIEPISRASADQRKGRCGRIAPGTCYRLYTEHDFQSRPEFTDAEIHRVNLASVMLQMQAFRLGDIATFPFIDPPDPRAVKDAVRLLEELQAMQEGKLTKTGQVMARMPIDPRLARMLVEAGREGAVDEVMIIVSALAVQDPRERPLQKAQAADQAHEFFLDEKSDFLSLLNLWRWLEEQRQQLTNARFSALLRKRFINHQRFREWREVHRQLRLVGREVGLKNSTSSANYRSIHECILAGSLSLIGQHDERGVYLGARNLTMRIFPGSGLSKRTPKWIVAGEIAETSRIYARSVAVVEPGWIEHQAAHLLKAQYSAPFWSLARGETMAHKNVSLYGLRLAENRQVSYFNIDRVVSRDLFIREGLVRGLVKEAPPFLSHNLAAYARVEDLEAKGRRRDILASDDDLYAFYTARIDEKICRISDLTQWLRKSDEHVVNALFMRDEDLRRMHDAKISDDSFPPTLQLHGVQLELKYRFAPGEKDDGVTLKVPIGMLSSIGAEPLEWSVPGMLSKLVEQWLRTLPKTKRRTLVPLPEKIDEFTSYLLRPEIYRQGRLLAALSKLIKDRFGLAVGERDWDRERVDPHLLIHIEVIDDQSKVLAAGRDIRALREKFLQSHESSRRAKQGSPKAEKDVKTFPVLGLANFEVLGDEHAPVILFPGLVDQGSSVDLELFDSESTRNNAHRRGLSRLALQQLGKVGGYFRRELDRHQELALHFATLGNAAQLKDELLRAAIWYCFFESRPLPKSKAEFESRLDECRGSLASILNRTVEQYAQCLALRFACVRSLEALSSAAYKRSQVDITDHLERLAPKTLLESTPLEYLPLLPRYLRGIQRRIETLPGHVPKDLKLINEIEPLSKRYHKILEAELTDNQHNIELGFYIEELRLNMFAEQIGRHKVANHPLDGAFFGPNWKVSLKRVDAQIFAEEQRVGLA